MHRQTHTYKKIGRKRRVTARETSETRYTDRDKHTHRQTRTHRDIHTYKKRGRKRRVTASETSETRYTEGLTHAQTDTYKKIGRKRVDVVTVYVTVANAEYRRSLPRHAHEEGGVATVFGRL